MNFKDLNLKSVYRTSTDDLLKDFYIPAISVAKRYDRAVGYFSTSLLSYALKGISSFNYNQGRMRLVIGCPLDDDEFDAINDAEVLKEVKRKINLDLNSLLSAELSKVHASRLKIFCYLVATERLEVRLALKKQGMFHEKIGIFYDSEDNKILFNGSANETLNALDNRYNYESVTVYSSWEEKEYSKYAEPFELGFEKLWDGKEKDIKIIKLPSDSYEIIAKKYRDSSAEISFLTEFDEIEQINDVLKSGEPVVPNILNGSFFKLKDHQKDALSSWQSNNFKGILRLATGSGKTITAMYAVSKIFEKSVKPTQLAFVVAVPYVTLADQWIKEMALFNMEAISCFESRDLWEEKLNGAISSLKSGVLSFISIVVVNKTLGSPAFQRLIKKIPSENLFFVGDECHRHANRNISHYLPLAQFRMGLSATPYIESDELDDENESKDILETYYGNVVAEYTLAEAIADGVLTPYHYYIYPVELSITETEEYIELSEKIASILSYKKLSESDEAQSLIRKRNKIIQNASAKDEALISCLNKPGFKKRPFSIFYVGEGYSFDNQDMKELNRIASIASKYNWKLSPFTSMESRAERKSIMNSFLNNEIDGLISMKVLDEGVDIPQCSQAFILASSNNSRQFVQRRGRILRRYKGKDYAYIHDFFVYPNKFFKDNFHAKKIVLKESIRAEDFIRASVNRSECQAVLDKLVCHFKD
ncbi:DEAD/DEAH box helicase family protein [Alishewanella sp. d11]|uniref:DEAD/DEAH box helicase family protein n=1 Tax=Alishewanella sp. d11 TaxID=3414030 RepID=UPI003BF8F68E